MDELITLAMLRGQADQALEVVNRFQLKKNSNRMSRNMYLSSVNINFGLSREHSKASVINIAVTTIDELRNGHSKPNV